MWYQRMAVKYVILIVYAYIIWYLQTNLLVS